MMKKTRNVISSSKHEADVARYMKEVRDMQEAGVTRRDLFKMGLTASVGGLAAIGGASFMPNLAQAASKNGSTIISPPCNMPWRDPLIVPEVCQPVAQMTGPKPEKDPCKETISMFHKGCGPTGKLENFTEARTEPHQRWDDFYGNTNPQLGLNGSSMTCYELENIEVDWNFFSNDEHPTFNSKVWTYRDMTPNADGDHACAPLRIKAQYGEPVMMRMHNCLPMPNEAGVGGDNQGFGINQMSPHLHNAHNPPESDGGPNRFFDSCTFYDYWYPNVRAGFTSTHALGTAKNKPYIDSLGKSHYCPGDWQETQSSLWFHDHRMDFTSQNVYKGMAAFYSLFSKDINLDTDDETTGLRLPSGKYDIPLIIGDKTFDQNGQLFMDIFNSGGWKGDHTTVNFKIRPFLNVERRKYRFRTLNGGPSTFLELALKHATDPKANMTLTRIANCGNLMPQAQLVPSIRQGVAERADFIVDFSQFKKGDVIYLHNVLESIFPSQGTTGKILPFSDSTAILKFIVGDLPSTPDYSGGGNGIYGHPTPGNTPAALVKLQKQKMIDFPTRPAPKVKRRFDFNTKSGAWVINGNLYSPMVMSAYPAEGSCEEWEFTSGGGWSHPVHIHHEEGQVISRNSGAPALDDLSRKDVYRIGQGSEGTAGTSSVIFRMQFRDWLGDYPTHCHNVVHEDHGMMFRWKIVPPTDPKAGK
ncbi:MAG: multicopper oxidase domain-containing protein [Methylococcales bacterium]|nr:multicopper oxidase domain-containing protein [Methylococcales bacterium]